VTVDNSGLPDAGGDGGTPEASTMPDEGAGPGDGGPTDGGGGLDVGAKDGGPTADASVAADSGGSPPIDASPLDGSEGGGAGPSSGSSGGCGCVMIGSSPTSDAVTDVTAAVTLVLPLLLMTRRKRHARAQSRATRYGS
jgi:hypothetical protein